MIAAQFGRQLLVSQSEAFVGETAHRCPDIAKQRLGFEPKTGLAEGLPPVIAWHRANQHLRNDRLFATA